MSTVTIKPKGGGITLQVMHVDSDYGALINVKDFPHRPKAKITSQAARYPLDELLAALGAVPAEKLAEGREHLEKAKEYHVRLSEMVRNVRRKVVAAEARAEAAEAKLAELEKDFGYVAASRDEYGERAVAAEATLARVKAVRENLTSAYAWVADELDAAMNTAPAFTLPSEAGARFEAQGNYDKLGQLTRFVTLAGGNEPLYMAADDHNCVYTAAGVREYYANHRLIQEG